MSAASDGTGQTSTGVSHQLATLVPTFDPSKDDLHVYSQKVELVYSAWPKDKIPELVTRLILNCTGSAFQKLQIHHTALLENSEKSVKKLIELLGGHWGKIGLERQYEDAENALFHTVQLSDESNDSFLARADIMWSKLLSRKLTLEDLQAYILLRGSTLTAEEKKKVILESDQSLDGKLTVQRVSEAVRILGAAFFLDMTGQRKTNKTKVYSATTLVAEESDGEPTLQAEDGNEDEFEESLLQDGDPDAALVADFETAATELIQDDPDLSSAFSAYQDARRRLSEKFRNRGFFPTSRGSQNSGFKGEGSGYQKSSGKGRGFQNMRPRRSLQDRILNSFCRQCGRKGHWRAECPYRQGSAPGSSGPSGSQQSGGSAPTSTVTVDQADDMTPLEFMMIPEVSETTLDEPLPCYVNECMGKGNFQPCFHSRSQGESINDNGDSGIGFSTAMQRLRAWGLRNERSPDPVNPIRPATDQSLTALVKTRVHNRRSIQPTHGHESSLSWKHAADSSSDFSCFASQGSNGVLDLGASKTVIGSECVPELIQSLDASTRQGIRRTSCNITFRFGNQATLTSKHAIVLPLGNLMWKIAVVPGGTPFLISNTLMRALKAQINCENRTLTSPMLHAPVGLTLTPRGLFLLDVNQLVKSANVETDQSHRSSMPRPAETFMSDETEGKSQTAAKQVRFDIDKTKSHVTKELHSPLLHAHERNAQKNNHVEHTAINHDPLHNNNLHDTCQLEKPPCTDSQESEADSNPAQSSKDHSAQTVQPDRNRDVPGSALASAADSEQCAHRKLGTLDASGVSHRSDHLRDQAPGGNLRGSLERHRVGDVHAEPLPDQHKREPPEVHPLHRAEDRSPGERPRDHHQRPAGLAQPWSPNGQSQGKASGQKSGNPVAHLFAGWRGRLGHRAHRVRDVQSRDYECPADGDGGRHECAPAEDAPHGECSHPGDCLHREPVDSEPGVPSGRCVVREDWESEAFTAMHHESHEVKRMIDMITKEFLQVQEETKPMGPRWDLGEVMCSEKSPLTQQILNAGGHAFRFGLCQGDVSTTMGRQALFQKIVRHRPKHIWYSPTCGPWSSWSQLNASRSLFHQEMYREQRHQLLYQLSLGIVLYRHQVENGDHFHWEQPQRSLMFRHPCLAEVHMHTQACQFDMCRAGNLRCPETQVHMKKGMMILTTHAPFFSRFHGMSCDNRHPHQPIEGSCRNPQGETMLRTKFTEVYPRKFARSVAQLFLRKGKWWPFQWKPGMSLQCVKKTTTCCPAEALAVANKFRGKPKFALSELVSPTPHAMPGVKRAKVNRTDSGKPSLEVFQELFQKVDTILPRVGKKELENQEIIQQIQSMFPEKQVVRVMACRGRDWTYYGTTRQTTSSRGPLSKNDHPSKKWRYSIWKELGVVDTPCKTSTSTTVSCQPNQHHHVFPRPRNQWIRFGTAF